MFVEKAYAKYHGGYEKLNSGSVAESMVDLSGGVSQKILLTEDATKAAIKDGSLWKRLERSVDPSAVERGVAMAWWPSVFAAACPSIRPHPDMPLATTDI